MIERFQIKGKIIGHKGNTECKRHNPSKDNISDLRKLTMGDKVDMSLDAIIAADRKSGGRGGGGMRGRGRGRGQNSGKC